MEETIDISFERYREYVYPDGSVYIIERPKSLFITKSGGHRVFDIEKAHIVRSGWVAIRVPVKDWRF